MLNGQASRAQSGRHSLPRRALLALLGGLLAAGCGAGFNAASVAVRPNGGSGQNGIIKVNNVWVVLDPATRNAEVIGAVANTGRAPDRLTSVKAGGETATVRPATPAPPGVALPLRGITVEGDSVLLAGGAAVSFGRPGSPELEIPSTSFATGRFTRVELDFQRGGTVSMNALVMANTGLFAEYDPNAANPVTGPTPTPSTSGAAPSGSASASASTSASGPASASGSASASPTTSP